MLHRPAQMRRCIGCAWQQVADIPVVYPHVPSAEVEAALSRTKRRWRRSFLGKGHFAAQVALLNGRESVLRAEAAAGLRASFWGGFQPPSSVVGSRLLF